MSKTKVRDLYFFKTAKFQILTYNFAADETDTSDAEVEFPPAKKRKGINFML